ncbi:unnamed protein product, partial [Brassica oleracea var. botrytis]
CFLGIPSVYSEKFPRKHKIWFPRDIPRISFSRVEEEQYYRDLSLLAEHEHDAVETWDVATGAHSVLRPDSAASEEMALAWVGLGYNREIDTKKIERSAVIHFNGHSKPWTELGISKYQPYWIKYIDLNHPYISSCRLF